MTFYEIFWYFILYAFLGWCLEVCFCTLDTGQLVNRGFLNGPLCPIYGFGMLFILVTLLPLQDNLLALFVGAVVVTSLLELVGGWALKKLFHTSWWDYSDQPFNLGGYICLKFSLAWGIAGVAAVRVIHPLLSGLVHTVPHTLGVILAVPVGALLLCDLIVTVLAIAKINRDLGVITNVAETLRAGSDALSKTLGEGALDADEKLDAVKQGVDEKLDAAKHAVDETVSAAGRAAAQTRESVSAAAREAVENWAAAKQEAAQHATRLQGAVQRHTRAVQHRLLRAYPKMRNTRYTDTFSALRAWLDEAAQKRRKK